ncbi:AAA family ATPase [Halodesulfurarchaeum sp. HSR-GB]|uniref:TrlF family AAA-like ATPase n=1 Tax=Halodesulfurarchaeum sp. HSR-GB TaxID=3074077 RepID=UPI002862E025|nr:AAA family ATPase [Halodesulfurarchaeum sp. HSR-GB]MDR5656503.1 AAA family ATPase [Halodesulfurarchaeum sp. HSR-GB]
MTVNRGSEWRKWDLHVHTPLSFESHYEISESEREDLDPIPELSDLDTPERLDPLIWTKFIDELEDVDNVDNIAITDYFSLEGYEIIQHLRAHGYLDNFDVILPNIEFRLGTFTGEHNRVNLHVVFSEDVTVDNIRQEFLTNLTIKLDGDEERSLRPASLKALGEQAKRFHEDSNTLSDFEAGCKYAWVDFGEIVDEIDDRPSIFEGNHLIVLSGAEWSEISWFSQDAEIRRQLLVESHALFSGNPNDRAWATGQADLSAKEFKDEFGSLKPVLHGSDAHNFKRLCQPDKDRYCWVKANNSFEGLKQVVFEPIDRLHIGPTSPEGFTQIHTLDSLKIRDGNVNTDLEIADENIPFNSNLVTVIGNQGAGKTALLDFVANCFNRRTREHAEDENSFISRIEDSSPTIETELTFKGGDIQPFSKKILEPETVEGPDISHIPQGKIVEYCEKGNELHDRIRTLVTESVRQDTTLLVSNLEQKKSEISDLAQNLRSINAELHEINPQQVEADIAEERTNRIQIETLLDNKKEEIEQFKEANEEELQETEAEELQSELDDLDDMFEAVGEFIEDINSAHSSLEEVEQLNELLKSINDRKELIDTDRTVDRIELDDQRESLNILREEAKTTQEDLSNDIEEIRGELEKLDEVDEELSNLLEEKRQIEERLENSKDNLSSLSDMLDKTEKLKEKRENVFISYVDAFFDLKEIYGNIASDFSEGETAVLEDIEFEPQIELEENRTHDFVDMLDNRSVNRSDIKPLVKELDRIVSNSRPDDLREQIGEYLFDLENHRENLLDSRDPIDFDSLLYGDCLRLSEEIYYQEIPMAQLSRGQKGTVLLRIYLAKGEHPLIIDSPEENLDNQFVFEELIGAVRDAKKDRQIFLATHDANLVVNTDSEQVIIAEFNEGLISFEGGALENAEVRDKAKGILEGGDEAFKLREEKYDLNPGS